MKPIWKTLALPLLLAAVACDGTTGPDDALRFAFDLNAGTLGWTALFADYPADDEAQYGLDFGHAPLPAPLNQSRKGLRIEGVNRSDDLLMVLVRRIDGLVPAAKYRVQFEVELATDAPSGCAGVGGAPGEGVWVKAGAAKTAPGRVIDEGFYRITTDFGQQSAPGKESMVLGHIANTNTDCSKPVYQLKKLSSGAQALVVTADASGALWLIVGTDSGFESATRLWYSRIEARLTPQP